MLSLKKYISSLLCLSICVSTLALAACKSERAKDGETTEAANNVTVMGENSFYSTADLSEYVSLCEYKGLTFDISDTNGSREDMENAVKKHIFERSEIKKYPDELVGYYFEQEKNFYMYLAKGDAEQYEALLAEAGLDENDLAERAKKYVAEDLVFYAITRAEDISVSDEEKKTLIDKYVAEYVDAYGYTEEYVKSNMSELIYDSMLYDKTMELLIASNSFNTKN